MSKCKISRKNNRFCFNNKGLYHSDNAPAIEWANGDKEWWFNGKRHRLDGPACLFISGHKEYWINGLRHRLDGPAIEYSDGKKFWFFKNQNIKCNSQEEFIQLIKLIAFW